MHLSEIEKDILSGKNGKAFEIAMNILVELGELFGAKRMISVSQVHIDMTLYMVDAGVEFSEKMAESGAKFAVPTQLNPASIDLLHHERMRVPEDLLEKSRLLENAYLKMGAIPTWTCAPYQQGLIPSFGEQIAWGESNAIAFVNSVKRIHLMHFMANQDTNELAAIIESLFTHANLKLRKAAPLPSEIADRFRSRLNIDQHLDWESPVFGVM